MIYTCLHNHAIRQSRPVWDEYDASLSSCSTEAWSWRDTSTFKRQSRPTENISAMGKSSETKWKNSSEPGAMLAIAKVEQAIGTGHEMKGIRMAKKPIWRQSSTIAAAVTGCLGRRRQIYERWRRRVHSCSWVNMSAKDQKTAKKSFIFSSKECNSSYSRLAGGYSFCNVADDDWRHGTKHNCNGAWLDHNSDSLPLSPGPTSTTTNRPLLARYSAEEEVKRSYVVTMIPLPRQQTNWNGCVSSLSIDRFLWSRMWRRRQHHPLL